MISIEHNFDPKRFKWLWAKYVRDFNPQRHCTNSILGWYSKKFSGLSPNVLRSQPIVFDERPLQAVKAIYICGVARKGYARHENYPHNVHIAIRPEEGATGEWAFEDWRVSLSGGRLMEIPPLEALPAEYANLPEAYTTCRIFRWAVVNSLALPREA